ncbi:hypothetical protein T265_02622 [Opisthorchis viverrini]|uniref:Threonylcarbamoyl-AMP synthase n=1 Tax=Opisthorchis viverrini TaxID=6198 RepID=A0A074ZUA6_OPIVI|nr:hypothetical protein T265_02622 [Opisthorchis viverrini]KER31058.1 hypothetical protein T265_02622 [Opisthorchis viverrini]
MSVVPTRPQPLDFPCLGLGNLAVSEPSCFQYSHSGCMAARHRKYVTAERLSDYYYWASSEVKHDFRSVDARSQLIRTTIDLKIKGFFPSGHFILEIRRSPRNELMNPHWLSLSKIPRIFCARQHNYISSTMTDKIISLSEAAAQLPQIVQLLRSGAVVAVPTDTIYGVSCSVHCEQAIKRIHQLKGRPMNKPMAICLDEVDSIPYWCDTTGLPQGLLNSLLPGPVTLLLPKHSCDPLNAHLNPDAHLVGVRVTDHGFVRDLCATMGRLETNGFRSVGHPLVLTSANLSGNASALRIEEFSTIWPELDLIVDGGPISTCAKESARSGSTIVDLSSASKGLYHIVRPGSAFNSTVQILENGYGLRPYNDA